MARSDAEWERFGREEPYFGVLASPVFRTAAQDPSVHARFFATGEAHVARVFATIVTHLDPDFTPDRVLDFGCGVGRLAIPFARSARDVVGVDVSPAMLVEAAANAQRAALTNLSWVRGDDTLSGVVGAFDLVHSFIVLQHIPRSRGEQLMSRLADRVRPGGVAALHITTHDDGGVVRRVLQRTRAVVPPLHWAMNIARGGPPRRPLMQMYCYELSRVMTLLSGAGFSRILSMPTVHGRFHGWFLFAQRSVEPAW